MGDDQRPAPHSSAAPPQQGASAPGAAEIVYHRACAGTWAAIPPGTFVVRGTGGASGPEKPREPTGRTSTLRVPENIVFRAGSQYIDCAHLSGHQPRRLLHRSSDRSLVWTRLSRRHRHRLVARPAARGTRCVARLESAPHRRSGVLHRARCDRRRADGIRALLHSRPPALSIRGSSSASGREACRSMAGSLA